MLLNNFSCSPVLHVFSHCLPSLAVFTPMSCYFILNSFLLPHFLSPAPFILSLSLFPHEQTGKDRDCCCACSLTLSAHKSLSTACMPPLLPPLLHSFLSSVVKEWRNPLTCWWSLVWHWQTDQPAHSHAFYLFIFKAMNSFN